MFGVEALLIPPSISQAKPVSSTWRMKLQFRSLNQEWMKHLIEHLHSATQKINNFDCFYDFFPLVNLFQNRYIPGLRWIGRHFESFKKQDDTISRSCLVPFSTAYIKNNKVLGGKEWPQGCRARRYKIKGLSDCYKMSLVPLGFYKFNPLSIELRFGLKTVNRQNFG